MNDLEPPPFPSPGRVRPDLVSLLVEAAAAPPEWASLVTLQARLDGDLLLDECELADLSKLLCERFGAHADLGALRAGLGLDALEALTVGDLQQALDAPRVRG